MHQLMHLFLPWMQRCVEFQKRIESAQEGKSKARLLYEQRIGELRNELAESCDRASYLEVCTMRRQCRMYQSHLAVPADSGEHFTQQRKQV